MNKFCIAGMRNMTELRVSSGSKPQASACLPGPELTGMQLCQGLANIRHLYHNITEDITSVEDPDPYVFGPPGFVSGCVSHKYGSGSGSSSRSFHHQAKIVRKILISSVLSLLCEFLPVLRIRGSGSTSGSGPKCHGSPTLDITVLFIIFDAHRRRPLYLNDVL
jgi:hypothetical protein